MLEELALRCDMAGAMNWLAYFLNAPGTERKTPCLALLLEAGADSLPTIENTTAAVLCFEFRLAGICTGAFCTYDESGLQSVIAPAKDRPFVAAAVAGALMERRGQAVVIAGGGATPDTARMARLLARPDLLWACTNRLVDQTLELADTYEATLMTLGKSTRFNLRYYRRRLLQLLPCEVVRDARGFFSEAELAAINKSSLNPVSATEFKLRYEAACTLPGGFLFGLRAENGQWIGLVGGWRQGSTTVLHWQANSAGYEKYSIGTVVRSYFLEHEVERGARRLTIFKGTTHTMRHAFQQEQVTDLIVRRKSFRAALIRAYAWLVSSPSGFKSRINFFTTRLCDPTLQWRRVPDGELQGATNLASRLSTDRQL